MAVINRATANKRTYAPAFKRGKRPAAAADLGTKNEILEAALLAFARDGFDGASLPKIAEIAKVAHPLIHYYIRSKVTYGVKRSNTPSAA
jgi:hypothetical protein